MLSLEPPDFPDLLYYFHQSLCVSQQLRDLVMDVESIPEMPCMCRGMSRMNWTLFTEQPARGWLSKVLLKDCTVQSVVSRPTVGVGNWTLESIPESSGMVDQGKALIIGISAGLTIALSVGAILILFRLVSCCCLG